MTLCHQRFYCFVQGVAIDDGEKVVGFLDVLASDPIKILVKDSVIREVVPLLVAIGTRN